MMAATTTSYAEGVRRALDDLPPATVADLLDGLEDHLAEIDASDATALIDALGPPERYAAELRASAGLPPRPEPSRHAPPLPPPSSIDDRIAPSSQPATPRSITLSGRHLVRAFQVLAVLVALWFLTFALGDSRSAVPIAVVASAAVWLLMRLIDRVGLATGTVPVAKAGVIALALLGAAAAGSHLSPRTVVVRDPGPTTTFVTVPVGAVPDFRGLDPKTALQQAGALGLRPFINGPKAAGDSVVVDQLPAPGSFIPRGGQIELVLGAPSSTAIPVPTTTFRTVPVTPTTQASVTRTSSIATSTIAATSAPPPTTTTPSTTAEATTPTTIAGAPTTAP